MTRRGLEALNSSNEIPLSGRTFVGRERELFEAASALQRACEGCGAIIALTGEPGIGKTRLARELARVAAAQHASVIWASCSEDGRREYWAWHNVFRELVAQTEIEADLRAALDSGGQVLKDQYQPVLWDGDALDRNRLRQFEGISKGLKVLSQEQPLVLVFDDVHAADDSSLALLGHVCRRLSEASILVVVTYRSNERDKAKRLADLLSESAMYNATTVCLGPLGEGEIDQLVRDLDAAPAHEQLNRKIAYLSGGNPRFVELLIANQFVTRQHSAMHPAIRAEVEKHISVSAESRELLEVASVLGDRFELPILLSASGVESEDFLNRLVQLEQAGLLHECADHPGQYCFSHPLVRLALYDGIAGARRAALHRRAGRVIEELAGGDENRLLVTVAEHFSKSAALGEASKALLYCERAADRHMANRNFNEALSFYERALIVAKLTRMTDKLQRVRLTLGLGKAQRAMGRLVESRQSFNLAAELAERGSDQNLRAEAVLEWADWPLATGPLATGFPDLDVVARLEKTLFALEEADSFARAMVMIRLSVELHGLNSAAERRAILFEEGTRMARRLDDGRALLCALRYRHLLLAEPGALEDRLANANEMLETASRARSNEDLSIAFIYRYSTLIEAGDVAKADIEAASILNHASKSECPWFQFADDCFATIRSLMCGRFDEVEARALASLQFAKPIRSQFVDFFWTAMLVPFEEKGRLPEILPMAVKAVEENSRVPLYRALLTQIQCRLGATESARENFGQLVLNGCDHLPRDLMYPACLAALTQVCVQLGDRQPAAMLYRRLEPFRSCNICFGPMTFFGPAPFFLGLLARSEGDLDLAISDFDEALSAANKIDARPWIAYASYRCATALAERNQPADRERAAELARRATEISNLLGMNSLLAQLTRVVASATSADADNPKAARLVAESTQRPGSASVCGPKWAHGAGEEGFKFKEEGDTCLLAMGQNTVRIRVSRGLKLILTLLSNPDKEFHVSELESPIYASFAKGNGAPRLDALAKSSYRARLSELKEDLEEAEGLNDAGRVSKIQEETAFIVQELARAVGLHGRDRSEYSEAERARSRVTQAIRSTIRKVMKNDRLIGSYLTKAIRTGNFCCYRPLPQNTYKV